ncbi:hypothetical protein Chor_013903 [Crotalus horridus]
MGSDMEAPERKLPRAKYFPFSSPFCPSTSEDALLKKPFQKDKHGKVAHRQVAMDEWDREEARNRRFHLIAMDAYARHKKFVNDYILYYGGKKEDFKRSGEKRLSKKYYDKLFKEYCIADLRKYKGNKVIFRFWPKFGFRWRHEQEVVSGKGKFSFWQFSCGSKHCDEKEGLKSWEVNFGYVEHEQKKNALVKLSATSLEESNETDEDSGSDDQEDGPSEADFWKGPPQDAEEKTREEEFDEYFQDLFL